MFVAILVHIYWELAEWKHDVLEGSDVICEGENKLRFQIK